MSRTRLDPRRALLRSRSLPPGRSAQGRPAVHTRAMPWQRLLRVMADTPLILWHYATSPRRIGAVAPSSRFLARAMAQWVPAQPKGYVLELGAGTGAVTEALLARGVPSRQLVAIETMPRLVEVLQRRFPDVHILQGDARHLADLIDHALGPTARVAAVVSSLPLRAFSPEDRARVVCQIHRVLPESAPWIQFRYRLRHEPSLHVPGFRIRRTTVVWWNIPPARVVAYEKQSSSADPFTAGACSK